MSNTDANLPHPYWIDFTGLYQRADAISHAFHSRNLVFFLGSGASKAFAPSLPNWHELLGNLLSELRFDNNQHRLEIEKLVQEGRYLLAAEAIKQFALCDSDNRDLAVDLTIAKILQQRLSRSKISPTLQLAILDFSIPIFTTNYDIILENLIADHQVDSYRKRAITYEDQQDAAVLLTPTRKHDNYIFKLHGSVDKTQRLIFDEKDYADFYFHARWPVSLQLLRHVLATKMVVFVGFSLSDPEIMLILREATRYSASYQHIALMFAPEITFIEREILRSTYRVDPILYEDRSHLPLFVMEMRNFFPREGISLQLKPEQDRLYQAISRIKNESKLREECSTILFGSFAKYGYLSHPDADVDVLFLTTKSTAQIKSVDKILARKIDATAMTRPEFERLLRDGDPFASSILVTGCPLQDPDGHYGILARGFQGDYKYEAVLRNAIERYQMRWLRLCIYQDVNQREYFQACHQWAITLMQLFIIKNYYSLDSLLAVSLLGNARYTIREFVSRFDNVDENFFLSLMRTAKGILDLEKFKCPTLCELVKMFLNILTKKHNRDDLEILIPGGFLQHSDISQISKIYKGISYLMEALAKGEMELFFGYGLSTQTESSLIKKLSETRKVTGKSFTLFDSLFFFRLHDLAKKKNTSAKTGDKELLELCQLAKDNWLKETADLRV